MVKAIKQIRDWIMALTTIQSTSFSMLGGTCYIYKSGRTCTLKFATQTTANYVPSDQVLATLPVGYRPISEIAGYHLHNISTGTLFPITIRETGIIMLRDLLNVGPGTDIIPGSWVLMNITYLTSSNPLA